MSGYVSSIVRAGAGVVLSAMIASHAWAQQPQPVRIRGSIENVDGAMLLIKTRDGEERKVKLSDNVAVTGIAKATLADIKPSSYIGVTGQPQPDGSQKAIAIHIFPEAMRGTGEGFRPWDLRPNSTMTNATVDQKVEANDGQTLTVKYKDGEKKVTVTPETPIVTFVPGNKSELKAGAKIIIMGATKKDDGTYEAARVNVGLDGLTPPIWNLFPLRNLGMVPSGADSIPPGWRQPMISRRLFCGCLAGGRNRQKSTAPDEALARLKAGNERFTAGKSINCNLMAQAAETAT
eukprot:gene35157-47237_t